MYPDVPTNTTGTVPDIVTNLLTYDGPGIYTLDLAEAIPAGSVLQSLQMVFIGGGGGSA